MSAKVVDINNNNGRISEQYEEYEEEVGRCRVNVRSLLYLQKEEKQSKNGKDSLENATSDKINVSISNNIFNNKIYTITK